MQPPMPVLHLSLEFDHLVYAGSDPLRRGAVFAGLKKTLDWLEGQLGLSGYPENTDYLRIELYRQALLQWAGAAPDAPFYQASFEADRFATAAALLDRRDELLLAGWNFDPAGAPERLQALANVETLFRAKQEHPETGAAAQGFADRFDRALRVLPEAKLALDGVIFYEPEPLLPPVFQRLLAVFNRKNIPVRWVAPEGHASRPDSVLAHFQSQLLGRASGKMPAQADGSLLVLRARRDSDAAVLLAKALAATPDLKPVFLLPELNRVLEQALVREGLPALGVLSASLARPSLQVLKLAPAFLWEPVDVFKIMEFVTLPVKPLDDGLALEIARVLAQKPGLFSDTWYAAALGYLEQTHVPDRA
ncbi:MAG: hypothetical protein JNK89_05265, partial [Saprospiraceae bacterium]|nr:hypothetical protein [Saprospiraceae bacterium]